MPTVEERAREAVNAVSRERGKLRFWGRSDRRENYDTIETICRLIEEFDAFKQDVSDAVNGFERYCTVTDTPFPTDLSRFILPKPVDPLVEVQSLMDDGLTLEEAIAGAGYKLVEIPDAN